MERGTWTRIGAGVAASLILLSGTAPGQDKPVNCTRNTASPSERVEGQVAKIDPDQGALTLRASNGQTYEFHASKETLLGYKVGDHIAAMRRSEPNCPPSAS
jgi:hypothetical protein